MKTIGCIVICFFYSYFSQAQNLQKDYVADQVMNWNSKAGANVTNLVTGFDDRKGALKGDYYLEESWLMGHVMLNTGFEIKDIPIRYDLYNHYLEIKFDKSIKVLNESRIESFRTFERSGSEKKYINASTFKLEDVPLLGFYEVLAEGECNLLKKTKIKIKEPDYVPAFDMGSMDTEIIKKTDYFLAFDETVYPIANGNNKNLAHFKEHKAVLKDYIKSNKLRFKRPDDAIKIVDFYNRLN